MTPRYHWVEDDDQVVLFVGNKSEALRWYTRRGGTRAGLHLISALKYDDGRLVAPPVVGEVWTGEEAGLGIVPHLGARVQIHPRLDAWMRGDRYGEVVGVSRDRRKVRVLLDKSGKTVTLHERDIVEEI